MRGQKCCKKRVSQVGVGNPLQKSCVRSAFHFAKNKGLESYVIGNETFTNTAPYRFSHAFVKAQIDGASFDEIRDQRMRDGGESETVAQLSR